MNSSSYLTSIAQLAQQSSVGLSAVDRQTRSQVIQKIASTLRLKQDDILEANTLDLEMSREMAFPDLLVDWLKLTPERLQSTCKLLDHISAASDPLFTTERVDESIANCESYGIRTPIGTIAFVYEAFPELAAIATAFCLRTGNVLMLRGGSEASYSNQAIVNAIQPLLLEARLPQGCLQLIPSGHGDLLRELLSLNAYIHLVVPYGRPSLVQRVLKQSSIPVLKTAIGNCYLYWSFTGDVEKVRYVILDSHQSEPDPVNAIDHVLIHRGCNPGSIAALFGDLKAKGFKLKGSQDLRNKIPGLDEAKPSDWQQPCFDNSIIFELVDSLDDAITMINQSSSGHADSIITESYAESREFATQLTSANVYINASSRFYRYHPDHGGITLGMSNQSHYPRGMIDFKAFTSIKRIVQGIPTLTHL